MDRTPIYKYPFSYAKENCEVPQYRASLESLRKCKVAIEKVISEQWDGMYVPKDAAMGVLKEFGPEKVALVLAYTVREKEYDTRISGHNQDWAKTIPMYSLRPDISDITVTSHPAKLDIFLDVAQKNIKEFTQNKTSVRGKLRDLPDKPRPPVKNKTGRSER